MADHKNKKGNATRGPGHIKRSKSGGAVKGKIPHAGGMNRTNHVTGVSMMIWGKDKSSKPKGGGW